MGNLFKRYENKGLRQGRKEGRAEGYNAVAEEMIKKNMSVSLISEITKLSLEQLQKLSKECGVALVM